MTDTRDEACERCGSPTPGHNYGCPHWLTANQQSHAAEVATLSRQLAEAKRKTDALAKGLYNCSQIAGKVLGYPWFKDDQKNFPGATEADGVCIGEHVAETIVEELARKCDYHREMWDSSAAATAAATNRALIAEERLAEAQCGVTKAMRAILEAAFAVQSRPAAAAGKIDTLNR